jgi:hypothetical protein
LLLTPSPGATIGWFATQGLFLRALLTPYWALV